MTTFVRTDGYRMIQFFQNLIGIGGKWLLDQFDSERLSTSERRFDNVPETTTHSHRSKDGHLGPTRRTAFYPWQIVAIASEFEFQYWSS